jgi:hypothetical protein
MGPQQDSNLPVPLRFPRGKFLVSHLREGGEVRTAWPRLALARGRISNLKLDLLERHTSTCLASTGELVAAQLTVPAVPPVAAHAVVPVRKIYAPRRAPLQKY